VVLQNDFILPECRPDCATTLTVRSSQTFHSTHLLCRPPHRFYPMNRLQVARSCTGIQRGVATELENCLSSIHSISVPRDPYPHHTFTMPKSKRSKVGAFPLGFPRFSMHSTILFS
jgi:hypothetical protein